ncbi:MAG: hypothetical protein Q9174_001326 [Haloplaca sp. 1 TL-2023]
MSSVKIVYCSLLAFSIAVSSVKLENRQAQSSSSLSIPTFTYGYFSDVYPNGGPATSPSITTPGKTSSTTEPSALSVLDAASGPGGQNTGPVGVSKEESFIASVCQPLNSTNQPDMNFPCNRLLIYEVPCVYNVSYETLLKAGAGDGAAPSLLSPSDQQKCFCTEDGRGHDYWQNSEYCSECRRLHGASAKNVDNFAPVQYIKAFSSAYCAQPSSNATALLDYATVWTSTATIDLGTSTGGTNVLGSSTAVSLYTSLAANSASNTNSPSASTSAPAESTTTPEASSGADSLSDSLVVSGFLGLGILAIIIINDESWSVKAQGAWRFYFVTHDQFSQASASASAFKFLRRSNRYRGLTFLICNKPALGSPKAFTITTSSYKKRRLSPPYQADPTSPNKTPTANEQSSPARLPDQYSSFSSTVLQPEQASNVTSSPAPPSSVAHRLGSESLEPATSPIPETSSTAASSPSAACAYLTIENESIQETAGVDPVGSKGRLNSLSVAEARSGPSLTVRSSSPAKRPASQMAGAHGEKHVEDVDMEDAVAHNSQARRATPSTEPAKSQRRRSANQHSRHKREMSLDPSTESTSTGGDLLPDRSRLATKILQDEAYHTSQPGASTTSLNGHGDVAQPFSGEGKGPWPSIDEQIGQVMDLTNGGLEEGQKGFIVSQKWLDRVQSRSSLPEIASRSYDKTAAEGPIGPVDNSGLELVSDQLMKNLKDEKGEQFIPLRPEFALGEDYQILPQKAWELIVGWYGLAQGSPIVARYCHNTSSGDIGENLQFELRPPIFTIVKMPDTSAGETKKILDEKDALPFRILASRQKYFQAFLKSAKQGARIEIKKKVRVWRILSGLSTETQNGMMTPAQSRSNSPGLGTTAAVDPGKSLILDVHKFAELQMGSERELIELNDETANDKYNGHLTLHAVGLGQDSVIVLEEQVGGPAGGEWVAEGALNKSKVNGVPISVTKGGNTKVQNNLKAKAENSRAASPAPGGMMTRGRARKDGRVRGTMGLSNLGNTCYMNSALQCIRSCEELCMYFLQDIYKRELNPNNPLSHSGNVAKAYASLIREMYGDGGFAFAPKNFKNVIGRYGPSFSGYGQQDSQEFLLFLLDGLQEDLNRIQKKPYIEKPDSTDEMVNDPAALRGMAAKCWDIYKARNDSVITDLFAGMYKSTVVCPVCDKVSIIFDPFNNLTLQLPIENVWSRTLEYFPLHSRPCRIAVDMDKNSTFKALKEYFAQKVGTDARRLIIAEIYRNHFYKVFADEDTIAEERIQDADVLAVFELDDVPTNWPPPKKKGQQKSILYGNHNTSDDDVPDEGSPQAEKLLITVQHRHLKLGTTRSQPQRTVFGVPGLIVVSREEARDFDAILRKILAHVQCLTSRDFLREADEADQSPEDSDTVLMNTEEGDSSSDSKVQAQSIDSEDGMVDISMAEAGSRAQTDSRIRYPPSHPPSKPPARMLRPGSFIAPEVRGLFDMKYRSSGDTIPASFTTSQDDNKELPAIGSRIPDDTTGRSQKTANKLQHLTRKSSSDISSDEDVDDLPKPAHSFQAVNTASGSDDDDDLPPVQQLVQQSHQGFSRFNKSTPRTKKGLITYSRQGKNRSPPHGHDDAGTEDGPVALIKPGEQIYVDWTDEGYDALFSGSPGSNDGEEGMRGFPTFEDMRLLPDPALDEKRRLRNQRRKDGVSLNDCLDEFGKKEILSENDAWYCPRCKEHRRASKQFELWTAPDILVIHLKRFSSQGRLRDKLDVMVDFPVEGLDLTDRVQSQEDGKKPVYDLFAVDNHYGGLGGGHYTAYAQNFYDRTWYEYNDSQVTRRLKLNGVVNSAAYLLFYRRRSDKPLGGPFFESIMNGGEESDPTSDATFSPGEGKRLDGSSRNGSSSALHGVGVAHQAGGGGDETTAMRTGVDDDLPSYGAQAPALESMDLDEGVADIYEPLNRLSSPSWSFSQLQGDSEQINVIRAPAASEEGSENLFEGDSMKAASSAPSEVGVRLAEFADDEGTTSGAFGPTMPDEVPAQIAPPPMNDDDGPVAEVTLQEEDNLFRD